MLEPGSPVLLYDANQARELDHFAIHTLQVPALTFMTRAGEAALRCLRKQWRNVRSVAIVCGGGNNAGDGYVLARLLRKLDCDVQVVQVGRAKQLSNEARNCYEAMCQAGVSSVESLEVLNNVELIVDALLGVGLNRDVSGPYAEAIHAINRTDVPKLSLDVPSGLDSSTGQIRGVAVYASSTISFMTSKLGLYTGSGPDVAGTVFCDDLETPILAYENVKPAALGLQHGRVRHMLSARLRSGHKGTHGHALLIGGALGYRGALMLAGESAARSGAGLVTLVGYADGPELINPERPEIMSRRIDHLSELDNLLERASVIAIGPGLGTDNAAMGRFSKVLETKLPLVVDADALRLLAAEPTKRTDWVLTPHPGEAAMLLGVTVAAIQTDRLLAAKEIASKYGGAVILKGAGSIVISDDMPEVLLHGNPGMGSGGMGDVLTGIIAGLVAQGLTIPDATRLGACVHARAGDRAALQGERGMLARDLMPHIRQLVN
ncbi:MAG: NAD(P)H-hydrate dehydratase [Pseudomonadota bacterium]